MKRNIIIIGTLDTKEGEVAYAAGLVRKFGHTPLIIDTGPLSTDSVSPDFRNSEVSAKAGWNLDELVRTGNREKIMGIMAEGTTAILLDLFKEGRLDAVLGIGGNQGSSISAQAMRSLPLGLPKFLVSTVASGNIRPYIGGSDIAVMFSVSDLVGGVNPVSRSILGNAVAAVCGMAKNGIPVKTSAPEKTIALTALGNTEKAANRIFHALRDRGYEVITFHASGAGGSAMEALIDRGVFGGIIDLTTHEIGEEIAGVGAYVPVSPGRMTAAGRAGIPQIISTGGLEYLCFGPRESIPPSYRRRRTYMHNINNGNVKMSLAEMKAAGALMAKRLNKAKGPVEVLIPIRAWSVYGAKGGPLHEPRGNAALLASLETRLRKGIPVNKIDAGINDEEFAMTCVDALLKYLKTDKVKGEKS